uniref:NADH-ubiquinone oxidoreductase chain 4 n=1 Tax=Dissostichus eleginoides TaxID=100907 RepID=I7GY51_DISEL|nr:NADH dehydrogenase subunit 4 [Dissostichus eleginoides]BAM28837.1 NADH dehydrogenase subunit 4 [Dissostichus eleginoides]
MLKVLVPILMLIPTIWLTPSKWLWSLSLTQSLLIAQVSFTWFQATSQAGWTTLNSYMATDPLSTPLLVLTCWLLPLMILASQHHMETEPLSRQRAYLTLLTSLELFLVLAFGATELIMFYLMFEATLLPTLMIITRWGNQAERLNAGTYFLFYTLVTSLPLFVALLFLQNTSGTLSLLPLLYVDPLSLTTHAHNLWWTGCLLAFLVKIPLYGFHLWLPKAHVEAPIAGSMILAAVLLKLGGYGMMRMMLILEPLTKVMSYPFIALALWGVVMAGSICLRQTDLKALIAYSSVSHMGLVVAGILIQTPWGFTGALILMIAHGLTSSALFCLANTNYERIHSRSILLARGLRMVLPLMAAWWLYATLANLALPPLPNLMGELMILSSMINWSFLTTPLAGVGILITASYSMYLFITTQRGPLPSHLIALYPSHSREHLTMALHLLPLTLLTFKPRLASGWAQ